MKFYRSLCSTDYGFSNKDIPSTYLPGLTVKPYGHIKTLANTELYCMKEIFMRAGGLSNLEYHVHKQESYFILKGTLNLYFRIAKGNNVCVVLREGKCFDLPRGMMHCRKAVTDVTILEASTRDSNSDSHLVMSGEMYERIMKEEAQQ